MFKRILNKIKKNFDSLLYKTIIPPKDFINIYGHQYRRNITMNNMKRIQVKNLSKKFNADFNSRLGALSAIMNFLKFKKEKNK
jgi:hypothetical protein